MAIPSLFDHSGNRLYLIDSERRQFETAAKRAEGMTATFCLTILYTGCRISEALNLKLRHIDYEAKGIVFETLKQRNKPDGKPAKKFRLVPVPDEFLDMLNMVHDIRKRVQTKEKENPIFTSYWLDKPKRWCRATGYIKVMEVMEAAELAGIHATPKGLRHGFAVACVERKISLNMIQKWLGHSSIITTAVYANAIGEEERGIAARLWSNA
jgi:integrase/recombinase XerD